MEETTQTEMERTYSYIGSDGKVADVKTFNNIHLVNALVKNATAQGYQATPETETNIKLLKQELLNRLATTPM